MNWTYALQIPHKMNQYNHPSLGGIIFLKFDWYPPSMALGTTSENKINVLIYYYFGHWKYHCCG
jgi:hypothetical protein